jgi:hypothetical protein
MIFSVYAENVIGNGEPSDIVSATPVYTPKRQQVLRQAKHQKHPFYFHGSNREIPVDVLLPTILLNIENTTDPGLAGNL